MNSEIAEQLLYESEATLRLVDSLLDELQDDEPRLDSDGMHTLQLDAAVSLEDLSEFPELLHAAATQARALLDAVAQSRHVLERSARCQLPAGTDEVREKPSAPDVRGGLERALLLVDRLEAESRSASVHQLLRDEIVEMLQGVHAQETAEQQLSYASSLLRDTELQLSMLVKRLSPHRLEVLPFSIGWANG